MPIVDADCDKRSQAGFCQSDIFNSTAINGHICSKALGLIWVQAVEQLEDLASEERRLDSLLAFAVPRQIILKNSALPSGK